jgi:ribosomal protein L7/L12
MIEAIKGLSDSDLGTLRRFVNTEFEARMRHCSALTEEEQQLLARSKIDCVKAVRERTGLGLADSKELVDRWQRGERA